MQSGSQNNKQGEQQHGRNGAIIHFISSDHKMVCVEPVDPSKHEISKNSEQQFPHNNTNDVGKRYSTSSLKRGNYHQLDISINKQKAQKPNFAEEELLSAPPTNAPEVYPKMQSVVDGLLHDTGHETEIIGREQHCSEIFNFCRDCVDSHKSGSMYLSGLPGTGKTLSVTVACERLSQWAKSVSSPREIYSHIIRKCFNCTSSSNAEEQLKKKLGTACCMILLVLDEIDNLVHARSQVLYNLFTWCSAESSTLILVGISNIFNLAIFLQPVIKHIKAPTEILYKPYSYAELSSIITAKFGMSQQHRIESKAIELCARKVASIDGDIRKAFNICIKATQLINLAARRKETVQVLDMNAAIEATYPKVANEITDLPLHHQAVLCSAVTLKPPFSRQKLISTHKSLCEKIGVTTPSKPDFNDDADALAGYNLLKISPLNKHELISVTLNKQDILNQVDLI